LSALPNALLHRRQMGSSWRQCFLPPPLLCKAFSRWRISRCGSHVAELTLQISHILGI
jgi:hypothetical protein